MKKYVFLMCQAGGCDFSTAYKEVAVAHQEYHIGHDLWAIEVITVGEKKVTEADN